MAEEPTTSKKSPRFDSNMSGHPVFGDLAEKFPQFRLPTFLQVLNRVRFLKKNQLSNRESTLRPIYNLVASELDTLWNDAFVVPVINSHSLATKLEREIEKKIDFVSRRITTMVNHPEKITAQISEMKHLYSITNCKCFLKATHR